MASLRHVTVDFAAATVSGSVTVRSGLLGLDVTNLVNEELRNLGKLLGVSVGGADVYSKRSPTCNGASLIG